MANIIKNATLTIDGEEYQVRSAPIFPGLESDEVIDSTWGVRQDQYLGGRTRYPQMEFVVGLSGCPDTSSVGCTVSADYEVKYSTGNWCNSALDVTCAWNMPDALLVSVTPGTLDITSSDVATYTITLRPNTVNENVE